MELLTAGGVMFLLLGAAGGVYYFAVTRFSHSVARLEALEEASLGLDLMTATIRDGVRAYRISRAGKSAMLAVVLPLDICQDGTYRPERTGSVVAYRDGVTHIFYLSDKTGAIASDGDLLWRATMTVGSLIKTPDAQWSLEPGTSEGRISGISAFGFTIDSANNRVDLALTVHDPANNSAPVTLTRSVVLEHHN
jgi:hypothetical protein